MKKYNKNAFTLVELLAVIVILAIILVIAVPKVMSVIEDATKASLEASAKMVASQVENQYTVAKTLGKEFGDTGSCIQEWAGLNDTDYESCTYKIVDGEAKVTLVGKGKFNGLKVVDGTRNTAIAVVNKIETSALSIEWYAGSDVSNLDTVKDGDGNVKFYRVSDFEVSIDNLEGVIAEFSDGMENYVLTLSMEAVDIFAKIESVGDNIYVLLDGLIVINTIPNNAEVEVNFPEPGIYVFAEAIEVISFSIGGRLKSTVIIDENSIKWDGNVSGLECISLDEQIKYCKVSDIVPSTNVESYKKLSVHHVYNDKYSEFDSSAFRFNDEQSYISFNGICGAINLEEVSSGDVVLSKGVWFAHILGNEGELSYTSEIQFE